MNWKQDVDYLSYFELLELIKKEGYKYIRCIGYWNHRFSFSRGLQTLNYDDDVLQLIKDVNGCEVIDLYVEHNISEPGIVDEATIGKNITYDDDEVQCIGEKFANNEVGVEVELDNVAEVEVELDNDAEAVDDAEVDDDVEVSDDAEVGEDVEVDDDVEVGDDAKVGDENEPELDQTTVMPTETTKPHDNDFHHDNNEDPDQLHTLPGSV